MLTTRQQAIVNHKTGAALVIAGPGAGKTHVLTHRVAALINDGVMPAEILLLTFTRRAANEMRQRIRALVGESAASVTACTFHALAARCLWQSGERLAVLTEGDAHDMINAVRKAMSLDAKELTARDVLQQFSHERNTGQPAAQVDARYTQIVNEYTRIKNEMRACDYDDLLLRFRTKLQEDDAFREKQLSTFQFIMVDEYQDTNPLQAETLRLLTENDNVMAVGDDAQSIYAFRGADVENILTFTTLFPHAVTYHLTENFRSVTPIVSAANRLIAAMPRKLEKTLTSTRGDGRTVTMQAYATAWREAEAIIQRIRGEFLAPSECAVLYRNSFHALTVELALTQAGIAYQKFGGRRITEAAHVRDLLACVWILVEPQHRLAWQRVLALLPGIGAKTAAGLGALFAAAPNVQDAMRNVRVPSKAREAYDLFCLWYQECRYTTTREAIEWAWTWYVDIFDETYADEKSWREEGLRAIIDVAAQYDTPQQFLNEFVLEQDNADASTGKLTLSTIHSAKGREWNTVFVIHAAETLFPAKDAEIEEERRLFYVAVTRAKDELHVSYPRLRQTQYGEQMVDGSRFFREMSL